MSPLPSREERQGDAPELTSLRVVWVSAAYGYGGELGYFADVFREFVSHFPRGLVPVSRDFPVDNYPELPLLPILRFRGVFRTRRRVGGVTYQGLRRIPSVGSLLRLFRLRPDVVLLVEFTPTALAGGLVARLGGARVVSLVESDPAYRGAPASRLGLFLKRLVARHADAVLVSNDLGQAYARKVLRVPPDRLVVGPYLTSAPTAPDIGCPAQEESVLRLLFVNSITDRKGLVELVTALAALPTQARERWRLDVVGSGEAEAHVRREVDRLGLTPRVTFHGRVPYHELGSYYRDADMVVCPTLADYRSLGGFEAVNAGKPVLVSRYDGAHVELQRNAPAAVVVDPLASEEFVEQLHEVILNPRTRRALIEGARDVPVTFTLGAVGDNLERAVAHALRSSG